MFKPIKWKDFKRGFSISKSNCVNVLRWPLHFFSLKEITKMYILVWFPTHNCSPHFMISATARLSTFSSEYFLTEKLCCDFNWMFEYEFQWRTDHNIVLIEIFHLMNGIVILYNYFIWSRHDWIQAMMTRGVKAVTERLCLVWDLWRWTSQAVRPSIYLPLLPSFIS